eukprot:377677-Pyramimonas_sp.AAC.2
MDVLCSTGNCGMLFKTFLLDLWFAISADRVALIATNQDAAPPAQYGYHQQMASASQQHNYASNHQGAQMPSYQNAHDYRQPADYNEYKPSMVPTRGEYAAVSK